MTTTCLYCRGHHPPAEAWQAHGREAHQLFELFLFNLRALRRQVAVAGDEQAVDAFADAIYDYALANLLPVPDRWDVQLDARAVVDRVRTAEATTTNAREP